ncbi:hypothetical protein F5X96DRAFT_669914 [Biscogniauxia mediterranea]|nr:hypothetical protein F5X96DRAFT_669914 [Biscogniauxia mediterranea]
MASPSLGLGFGVGPVAAPPACSGAFHGFSTTPSVTVVSESTTIAVGFEYQVWAIMLSGSNITEFIFVWTSSSTMPSQLPRRPFEIRKP